LSSAPCDWPLSNIADCPELAGSGDPVAVKTAAVTYLWNWTNKVFGLCPVTVRPCREDCAQGPTTYEGWAGRPDRFLPSVGDAWPFAPALVGGRWFNITCTSCGELCSCNRVSAIDLPGPIDSVVEVVVDGEVVPASAYRVDNRRSLIRNDGGSWPRCQDLSKPAGAEGTWSVEYRWGVPVPAGGQIAAAVLACEMAKALGGDKSCGLPERITQSVSREGVTVAIFDAFDGLEAGKTGLWLVDSWVASVTRPHARSSVHLPRSRRPSVTTYESS